MKRKDAVKVITRALKAEGKFVKVSRVAIEVALAALDQQTAGKERYQNSDKYRDYMREYMRQRREKNRAEAVRYGSQEESA